MMRPAFAEFFKSAELRDMEPCVFDIAAVVELQSNFGVSFYAGDGIDFNFLGPRYSLSEACAG
jgi:hypothetical protein